MIDPANAASVGSKNLRQLALNAVESELSANELELQAVPPQERYRYAAWYALEKSPQYAMSFGVNSAAIRAEIEKIFYGRV